MLGLKQKQEKSLHAAHKNAYVLMKAQNLKWYIAHKIEKKYLTRKTQSNVLEHPSNNLQQ